MRTVLGVLLGGWAYFPAISGVVPVPPPITLSPLVLSNNTILESASVGTVLGALSGKTSGSTLTLTGTGGGQFALSGLNIVTASALADGTVSLTVTETLAGASNSPRVTTFNVTIGAVDTTAPAINSASLGSISGSTLPIALDVTEAATVNFVIATSSTLPTPAQVAAGQTAAGAASPWAGNISFTAAGSYNTTAPAGLNASYYVFLSPIDAAGNRSSVVTPLGPVTINTAAAGGVAAGFYGDARTALSQTVHTFDSATTSVTQALPATILNGKYGIFVYTSAGVPSAVTISGVAATKLGEIVSAPENISFWTATISGTGSNQIVVTLPSAQDCSITLVSSGTKTFTTTYGFNRQLGVTDFPLLTNGTTNMPTAAGDIVFSAVRSSGVVSAWTSWVSLKANTIDAAPRNNFLGWKASAVGGSPEAASVTLPTFKWTSVLNAKAT